MIFNFDYLTLELPFPKHKIRIEFTLISLGVVPMEWFL